MHPRVWLNPRLDPPDIRVQGWQRPSPDRADPKSEPQSHELRFDLSLGRVDALKKTVYGRIAGDTTILAVPKSIVDELPRNSLAFRDRTLLSIKPQEFARVTIERPSLSVTVEAPPTTGARGTQWRMVEPVEAPTDESAVTALLLTLGNLRAETWESDVVGDGRSFGLDKPLLRVKWTLQARPAPGGSTPVAGKQGVLRIGTDEVQDGQSFYANIEGDAKVFTVNPSVVIPVTRGRSLHTQNVFEFQADRPPGIRSSCSGRRESVSLEKERPQQRRAWGHQRATTRRGVDRLEGRPRSSRSLAGLKPLRFVQYNGPFLEEYGLLEPTGHDPLVKLARQSRGVRTAGRQATGRIRVVRHDHRERYGSRVHSSRRCVEERAQPPGSLRRLAFDELPSFRRSADHSRERPDRNHGRHVRPLKDDSVRNAGKQGKREKVKGTRDEISAETVEGEPFCFLLRFSFVLCLLPFAFSKVPGSPHSGRRGRVVSASRTACFTMDRTDPIDPPHRRAFVPRIVPYPHPSLRYVSRPVERIDDELRGSIRAMFDLMYAARGDRPRGQPGWPCRSDSSS